MKSREQSQYWQPSKPDNLQYVITGINVLTGFREEMSRGMSRQEAETRLEREKDNRRRQRYQTHKRLRIEPRLPTQLTLPFEPW